MLKKRKTILKKRKILKRGLLRKPRAKLKKAIVRPKTKKPPLPVSVRENVVAYETAVESSKYLSVVAKEPLREMPAELPAQYGQDKITLLVRDPRWVYAYWEITPLGLDRVRKQLGDEFNSAKMALRVYDVSNINFNGSNALRAFDVSVNEYANNLYIETGGPGKSFCVDAGYLLPKGAFITIARSNSVHMPLEGPSGITDEEWMIPEERFARIYGIGFGLGRSSPVGRAWQEKIKHVLFSGIPASPGIGSIASPGKKVPQEKNTK